MKAIAPVADKRTGDLKRSGGGGGGGGGGGNKRAVAPNGGGHASVRSFLTFLFEK